MAYHRLHEQSENQIPVRDDDFIDEAAYRDIAWCLLMSKVDVSQVVPATILYVS